MKYFKKYPLFFVIVSLLCAVFVAGTGYNVYLNMQRVDAGKKLKKSMKAYSNALEADPSQKAIDDSAKNIKQLQGRLDFLIKDLTRASNDIFKPLTAKEGYQLTEQLRGMVNKWKLEAKNKDIAIPEEMEFSYKKYVAPNALPPRNEAVPAIWKQACVLDYIMKKLYLCKSEESPMYVLWVQREVLKEETDNSKKNKKTTRVVRKRKSSSISGDSFEIDKAITARKEGSLDTLAYRFVFAGHTDVLRRFLNQLKDFDAMLVVRSIDVRPADKASIDAITQNREAEEAESQENNDAGNALFGGNSENSSGESENSGDGSITVQNRTPVVTDNISEFTVVIEYVDVVTNKEAPKKDAKAEENKEEE